MTLKLVPEHHVTVRLIKLNKHGIRDPQGDLPWKWGGDCSCGWHCLSWEWQRAMWMVEDHFAGKCVHEDRLAGASEA